MANFEYNLDFVADIPPMESPADSPFEVDERWTVNDSSIEAYDAFFDPKWRNSLLCVVDRQLHDRWQGNVGMDLAGGSQGRALQDLLHTDKTDGLLEKALVTNFNDLRTPETKAVTNLHHINGDLAEKATWQNILAWQEAHAPDGLALILHRPFGPFQELPEKTYADAARLLVGMLRPGGVFFTQLPGKLLQNPAAAVDLYRDLRLNHDVAKIIQGKGMYNYSTKKYQKDSVIIIKKTVEIDYPVQEQAV